MMNIVVTGATSFLGAALVKELLRREHQVFAVVRPGSKNRQALDGAAGAHIVELPLERLDELDQYVLVPCQLFFHFGWDGSGSENRMKQDVQQKNVADSMKALEGARKLGCRRFLFSGSQAEYGIYQEAMREDLECHPVSEYGKAKVQFCHQAKARCEQWKRGKDRRYGISPSADFQCLRTGRSPLVSGQHLSGPFFAWADHGTGSMYPAVELLIY